MSAETIYKQLRSYGLTAEGACGLMGNFQAESAMRSNNVEDRSGIDDDRYVALVDGGSYDFATDYGRHYGFGLAQWTLASRKEGLQNLAKKRGVSIADEAMQVDFAIWELGNQFQGVWDVLTGSHDLYECARIVCVQYERPAVNNVDARYRFARDFFERLAGGSEEPDPEPAPDPSPKPQPAVSIPWAMIQQAMALDGCYHGPINGVKTAESMEAFAEYSGDILGAGR